MTIGSVLLGLALLLLVGLYLARPFLRRKDTVTVHKSNRQQLLDQKEAILTQILSLEFDFETGKVPEPLYQQQRSEMVAEAAIVLERLDNLPQEEGIDAEIEAAIAQLRERVSVSVSANGQASTERPETNGQRGRYCSECGTAVDLDDKFCTNCGHKLTAPPVTAAT